MLHSAPDAHIRHLEPIHEDLPAAAGFRRPPRGRRTPRTGRRVRPEQAAPPPHAFFGPGIPAALPGERLTGDVLRYLRSGADAGMVVPDAVDTEVRSVRVVGER
ncbi:hypothetical protein [Streptomyces yangpuensis]|uniref:hypothetical protein n=1 Tax=Streptomyces yangpuensis TaxID=1648182 RepID=UPI000629B9F0